MSGDASITLTWADGDHRFRLPIGQLRELQDKCGSGPFAIFLRLDDNSWKVDDIRETLRLGLIGGGKRPDEALLLVKRYVDERPLIENVLAAKSVLFAAIIGVKDDPVGKQEAEEAETETTDASPSPPSMEPAPPLDGHPDRSTNSAFGS